MKTLKQEWEDALPDLQMSVPFDLNNSVVAVFRVGSYSHGTYMPPTDDFGIDDVDMMVIVIPPPQYVLGLKRFEHAEYKHGKLDVVFYDWSKWLRMIVKSNPNVVGTLWLETEDTYLPNPFFLNPLYYSRGRLLSKRMYQAFVGYAKGQLYKMTHHAHQGYMGDKRKRLVEKFGYDVKNAAHLIRLLRMACEALETERLNVRRKDADELIAIKQGNWSKADVENEAELLFWRAEEALKTTALPEHPDENLLQNIMVMGYREWWTGE